MDALNEILNSPLIVIIWKILSVGWTLIGAIFLGLMTRFLNQFSKALKAIAALQVTIGLHAQTLESHSQQLQTHDDRIWEMTGQRNRRKP